MTELSDPPFEKVTQSVKGEGSDSLKLKIMKEKML